ncbi:MAG: hypothetical protein AAGD25_02855 [Cyanobacteria bacterium P01_F01_bin.150]
MGQRLPDVVELVTRKFREVANVVTNPVATARRAGSKKFLSWYTNQTLPGGQSSSTSDEEGQASQPSSPIPSSHTPPPPPSSISASRRSTANAQSTPAQSALEQPQDPATLPLWDEPIDDNRIGEFFEDELGDVGDLNSVSANYWQKKAVLLLQPDETLKGSQWYNYTIGQVIRRTDWVRWYGARNQSDDAVIIQEYILRQSDFSREEIEARQRAFERLISLNIAAINGPGEGRDFRIVRLVEAFAPRIKRGSDEAGRCYLVVKPLPAVSLKDYLAQRGSLPSPQIREVLKQLLQTLRFLQTACRITFSETQSTVGIPHGNLNLDTLFIRHSPLAGANSDRQFFIHVTDLTLWEHLIYPEAPRHHERVAQSSSDLGSVEEDLAALGRIGFQLAGGTVDPHTQEVIGLHDKHLWRHLDASLYDHLCCLIGERTPFKSAESALKSLLNPPASPLSSTQSTSDHDDESPGVMTGTTDDGDSQPSSTGESFLRQWWKLLLLLGLLGLGAIALSFCGRQPLSPKDATELPLEETKDNSLAAIGPLPTELQYHTEESGAWRTVLDGRAIAGERKALSERQKQRITPTPLLDEIAYRNGFTWTQNSPSFQPRHRIINFIQDQDEHIGFLRDGEDLADNPNIDTQTIAHDGLAILVPFTDAYNGGNAPEFFNGQISIEQLRKLYTRSSLDEVVWNGEKIDLYFPPYGEQGEEAVLIFKEKVLENNPELEALFDKLRIAANERDIKQLISKRKNDFNINNNFYELMLDNYTKERRLAIGFDRFSEAFGQCSTYPLAVGSSSGAKHQPLRLNNDDKINPKTDLCGMKGSYYTHLSENYPLRYDLVVAYKSGSEAGAQAVDVFHTLEAQYLIGEMGLMPVTERSKIYDVVWRQKKEEDKKS